MIHQQIARAISSGRRSLLINPARTASTAPWGIFDNKNMEHKVDKKDAAEDGTSSSSNSNKSDGSSSSSSSSDEEVEDLMQYKDPTNRGVVFAKGAFLLKAKSEESLAAKILGVEQFAGGDSENGKILKIRNKHLGPNIAAFYKADGGLVIKDAKGCYMHEEVLDKETGEKKIVKHLDCANNVAHVGHTHPTVVKAGQKELGRVQTNARFLNPIMTEYMEKLLKTFPKELDTVYFANSGSEANDLALRMAKTHARQSGMGYGNDTIILDHAYHGHTQSTFNVSPYKWYQAVDAFDYHPRTTKVVPSPDAFRGKYRGFTAETGYKYALEVKKIIDQELQSPGAFIHESIVGCGGQILLPPTFLQHAYKYVRAAGGVCIADEVQTGFGRVGSHFWAFQSHGVVPDIVTVGKPMGNGYPVSAVICTKAVAKSFARTGIEYFATYAGNSVACAIASATFDVIIKENLQKKALKMEKYFKDQLNKEFSSNPWVGDVRGQGLFLGIEFVKPINKNNLDHNGNVIIEPHGSLCKFVVDYLRFSNIIISRDGPDENVIKIKPPMVFGVKEADLLINGIKNALRDAKNSGEFE